MQVKERILIIEDSQDIIEALTNTILGPRGYEPLVASSWHEGLSRAVHDQPDLVILDLKLPAMTSMEVVRGLHETVPTVPVVLMIDSGSEEIAAEAFRLGVRNYVLKPLEAEEVLTALDDALGERRLRREKELLTEELMQANKQLNRRVRELTLLHEITQAMTDVLDLETLLWRVVDASVYLTGADEGMLFLVDEETGQLYLRAAKGVGDKRASMLLLPAPDSLIGQVAQTGEPLRIASSDPRLDFTVKTGYMVNSLLYVPLKLRGNTKGVLAVSNRIRDRAFTRTDQSRVDLLADHAVIALETAKLYETKREQMTNTLGDTLNALAQYACEPLKALAADTYALKANTEKGFVFCVDDTLNKVLNSMEQRIEQMASITEILNGLASLDSTAQDRKDLSQRLEKLKARYPA